MSTELAERPAAALPEAIEAALLHGDLKRLTVAERLVFYQARCRSAGLDPKCRPFAYLELNGKTVLYALKECAEQLNSIHGISHMVSGITVNEKGGIIEVMVEAEMRNGRRTFDMGCVKIGGLTGEALANAKMKAITKAKRRATLSLCGLGDMPDESELDTMDAVRLQENGQPAKIDNGSGHATGKYASEEQTRVYMEALDGYLDKRNAAWFDRWTSKQGEVPEGLKPLCNHFQADNHLVKWAIALGLIAPGSVHESGPKAGQLGRLTAILYHRPERKQLAQEMARYVDEQERVALQVLQRKHPELFEDEPTEAAESDIEGLGDQPEDLEEAP